MNSPGATTPPVMDNFENDTGYKSANFWFSWCVLLVRAGGRLYLPLRLANVGGVRRTSDSGLVLLGMDLPQIELSQRQA